MDGNDFKKYLKGLKWNTFSEYPPQMSDIYIYFRSCDRKLHKFLRVYNFNAVSFQPNTVIRNFPKKERWDCFWLPIDSIQTEYEP